MNAAKQHRCVICDDLRKPDAPYGVCSSDCYLELSLRAQKHEPPKSKPVAVKRPTPDRAKPKAQAVVVPVAPSPPAAAPPAARPPRVRSKHPRQPRLPASAVLANLSARGMVSLATRIAGEHHVTVEDMLGPSRFATDAKARRHLWGVVRHTLGLSYPEMSRIFGRDHTSILDGIRKYERDLDNLQELVIVKLPR